MSADLIVGISVLQRIWVPDVFRIWFTAQKADGHRAQGWVFIRDAHRGGPDEVVGYPANRNPVWNFKRHGYRIDCYPSVNWISFGFHNDRDWSVDYVEMFAQDDDKELPREFRGSAIHYDLNLFHLNPTEQQSQIALLRERGILRPPTL
jgi:hypothetical protein